MATRSSVPDFALAAAIALDLGSAVISALPHRQMAWTYRSTEPAPETNRFPMNWGTGPGARDSGVADVQAAIKVHIGAPSSRSARLATTRLPATRSDRAAG